MPKKARRPLDLAQLRRDIVFSDTLLGHHLTFHSTWGLFSPKAIDEGSRLLLDHLEVRPDDRSIDLGCGYGPLGLAIARSAPLGHCLMVDKDFVAVEYANGNAARNGIPNARAILSDGLRHVPEQRFTLAVTNLPAKTSKEHYYLFFHEVPGSIHVETEPPRTRRAAVCRRDQRPAPVHRPRIRRGLRQPPEDQAGPTVHCRHGAEDQQAGLKIRRTAADRCRRSKSKLGAPLGDRR